MADLTREESRIRDVYHDRLAKKAALYAWYRPDAITAHHTLRIASARFLSAAGFRDLREVRALDVGCGDGGWIRTLLDWGAAPSRVFGVDLLPQRIAYARERTAPVPWIVGSAFGLPVRTASMDLVTTHTLLSSVLDEEGRRQVAAEMLRVLRPTGVALIYDFRISDPRNPNTLGIGRRAIKRLYAGCTIRSVTLTLAPPIARRVSARVNAVLEACLPPLRTHALHAVRHPRP